MAVRSAGILLYRQAAPDGLELWIAHMGGPFWERKQVHSWSIPKGEYLTDEDPLAAALREFAEEMGNLPPSVDYFPLGEFRQPSGKIITVFAAESDFQPERILSNTFPLEWPKGSGEIHNFPEVDEARWVAEADARSKLVKGQIPVVDALVKHLRLP